MQVDILVFNNNNNIRIKDVKKMLSKITGISINQDIISFGENDISYELKLSANKRYVYLTLELESNNKVSASVLSSIKDLIRKGEHRAGYKIAISYDESSMYYNEKLFSFISEHESKLRQLLYLILIDTFGSTWVQQTLDEKQQDDLKAKLRGDKIIERGLEAFSYQEYISFLFNQRPNKFTNDFIEKAIEEIELAEEINKSHLIAFLRDNKSYSLWESSFSEIDYAEAEKDIKLIRNIRNGVMHNKEISTQEFDANKKLIRKSNRGLDKAIEYVKSEHSREVRPNEVIISLQMTLENIGAKYAVSIKPMRDLVIAISESISKINNSNDLDIEQLLQKNITSNITITIPTLPSLYENNGCMDSIREMQNFHQRNIGLIPKINNPELIVMDSPELPAEPLTDEEAEDGNSEEDGNLENDENNDSNG